jgi:hypothetical protein
MTTYLWILKTHKCYNVLFVEQNKHVLIICANDLNFEKFLSNITSLMGSFLWKPTLNLRIQMITWRKLVIIKKIVTTIIVDN